MDTVLDLATNTKLAMIPELRAMIKGFKQHNNQVQRFKPPKWELNPVLCALMRTPFRCHNAEDDVSAGIHHGSPNI